MKNIVLDRAIRVKLPILIFTAVVSFLATYFLSRAERNGLGYSPSQPIRFFHRLHAGAMQIDCRYCHTGVVVSRHAGIPPVSTCMNCHSIARKDRPEIVKLTGYYESGSALNWKRVHKVQSFAYFSHGVHVNNGLKCENCHGRVENMERIIQVSEFTMGACLDCHRNAVVKFRNIGVIHNGPDNCWACHR